MEPPIHPHVLVSRLFSHQLHAINHHHTSMHLLLRRQPTSLHDGTQAHVPTEPRSARTRRGSGLDAVLRRHHGANQRHSSGNRRQRSRPRCAGGFNSRLASSRCGDGASHGHGVQEDPVGATGRVRAGGRGGVSAAGAGAGDTSQRRRSRLRQQRVQRWPGRLRRMLRRRVRVQRRSRVQ
uniref:Uncharacterized protein n=1 Tax=Hordeum vulgare subsp. vulgare TaxID=112509 RepID=A0A8I6Y4N2_HORVV